MVCCTVTRCATLRAVTLDTRLFDVPSLTLLVTFDMYSEEDIKSDSAMSSATEPARPRCFPPGDAEIGRTHVQSMRTPIRSIGTTSSESINIGMNMMNAMTARMQIHTIHMKKTNGLIVLSQLPFFLSTLRRTDLFLSTSKNLVAFGFSFS